MDRSKIKSIAKTTIKDSLKWKVLLALIIYALILGIPSMFDGLGTIEGETGAILGAIGGVLSVIAAVLLMPLSVGLALYMLNVVRYKEDDIGYLFSKFDEFVQIFICKLVTDLQIALGYCLLIVPGIIWQCKYSQLDYVIADNPGIKWDEARKKAASMMDCMKMDYFVFILSFIGWYFLAVITFGIALIYIAPYVKTAESVYYEELRSKIYHSAIDCAESEKIE